MGRQIVRSNQNVNVDEVASVVSAIINTSTGPRRRRRVSARTDTSISSTEYEDHLKIDRILYNAFGDIMSIARTTELNWMAHYNDEENNGISLKDAQNDAIGNFLVDFVQEQQESFIEAIVNLSMSQEMPEPPTDNGNDVQNNRTIIPSEASIVNNPAVTDASDSEASSIISLQRVVAPYSAVRNTSTRERSVSQSRVSGENASGAATIHSDPRISLTSKTPPNPNATSNSVSKTPLTPPFDNNRNSFENASQFSFGGTSLHSDIGDMRYRSSSDNDQNPFYLEPTESFQFENFQMDLSQSQQQQTQSKFFTQPFTRTQSHNNLYTPPNDADNSFSSILFASPHGGFDDFGRNDTFALSSFSSKTSSESQQQRRRPNLSNIRKNAVTSQSLAHLLSGSSSGISASINIILIIIRLFTLLSNGNRFEIWPSNIG